jgi:hypothetical protein
MVLWLAPTLRRTLVTNWRNGNFLIGAGALGVATSAAMAWDEHRRDQKAAALGEVRMALTQLGQDEKKLRQQQETKPKFTDRKPQFSATIVRRVETCVESTSVSGAPDNSSLSHFFSTQVDTVAAFDGPLALTDVVAGQRVQVLEADCGPEKGYHEVRNESGEGLYPKAYIEPDIPRRRTTEDDSEDDAPATSSRRGHWLSWRRRKT